MYSRKNHGYSQYTPPPNYNGVAFTRNFKPSTEIPEKDEVQEEELIPSDIRDGQDAAEDLCEDIACDDCEDVTQLRDCIVQDNEDPSERESKRSEGYAEASASKELTIEDLLIIGAVILFVSGEFDGDLMLLLGLLLIAGI